MATEKKAKAVKKSPAKKALHPGGSKKAARKGARKIAQKVSDSKTTSGSKAVKKATKTSVKQTQSVHNIKRIDSNKTHGWQVHLCRGGILKTKLFSDRVHGSKQKALTAAKVHRDELLVEMSKVVRPSWQQNRTPKTNTGYLGLSYTEAVRKSGKVKGYISVTARISKGKAVNRKISTDQIGYDAAIKKALAWRSQKLAERAKGEMLEHKEKLKK